MPFIDIDQDGDGVPDCIADDEYIMRNFESLMSGSGTRTDTQSSQTMTSDPNTTTIISSETSTTTTTGSGSNTTASSTGTPAEQMLLEKSSENDFEERRVEGNVFYEYGKDINTITERQDGSWLICLYDELLSWLRCNSSVCGIFVAVVTFLMCFVRKRNWSRLKSDSKHVMDNSFSKN
eukprot:TRINITY_DN7341_c0_g1_i1.p1 TRINITY_DN7341_c0_g1~~TRINITY_DN7341_c0_g1_i1.p1  ORF type:complete len:179 (+),score=21.60 TRINITY_DN7341_c0_g1_i1:138-674(+)